MIPITRTAKPAILTRKEAVWLQKLDDAKTESTFKLAQGKYRHHQIQAALAAMFHGKCAYCESQIEHVSDAHIEHYRPKSIFRELTFSWENLLLACGKCNSPSQKGDKFPEIQDGGPFLNPCIDQPEEHLSFVYDTITSLASVYGKTVRGSTTERELGLNRPDLRTYRSKQIKKLAYIADKAHTDPRTRQLLDEACEAKEEYAAFARMLRRTHFNV